MRNKSQMKYGALISYVLIVGNALFGLLVTPFVLKTLGTSSYGVYKTVGSISSSLLVLDLGIGGTLMRYIAKYRANGQDEKIGPFVSMMLCEMGILIPVVVAAELVLYSQLDSIYGANFSPQELLLAKQVYAVLSVSVVFTIVENFLNGIITGYNQFILGNGLKLLKLTTRILLIYFVLPAFPNAVFLVWIQLGLSMAGTLGQLLYVVRKIRIPRVFAREPWEKGVFKESFLYTFLMFLTALAVQVNNNLDNVIIGSFCGAEKVTVYSFGLVIFGMFEQLSTSISGVALPTVSRIVAREDWHAEIQKFIIRAGRVQFALLGAAVMGFAVLGKEFLGLWLGEGFDDVYIIVLILMIPSLFELCVNVCLAVLRAKNMLGFRTGILVLSTLLNLLVSIAGIHRWGYFSAALGTAASFLVGSLIIMNWYYYRKFGFNMFSIYGGILNRTWLCLLAAAAGTWISFRFLHGSWLAFAANVAIFMAVYAAAMLAWGFTQQERAQVLSILRKFSRKQKR